MRIVVGASILLLLTAACNGSGVSPMAPTSTPEPTAPATPAPTPTPSPTPAPQPTPTPPPAPDPGPTVLRTAQIGGVNGHSTQGTARIVRDGNSYRLELGSNFRIDSGNNDVYLTRSASGIANGDLSLGAMKATSGAQSYAMPDDGGAYGYVMLWCRPFRLPIGVGELQ